MTLTARILIVEDERIVAFDLQQKLEGLGYSVVGTVAAGLDAVRLAEEAKPDLVLMDIHLEGDIDGIEAARGIAESFGIPVLFLTAYATDDVLGRIQDGIAEGFVVKPFDLRMLHASIQTVLARRRASRNRDTDTNRIRAAMKAVEMGTLEWQADSDTVLVRGGPDEAMGQAWRHGGEPLEGFASRVHPDDRARFIAWFRDATPSASQIAVEFRMFADAGGVIPVRVVGRFEHGASSKPIRFTGVVRALDATAT